MKKLILLSIITIAVFTSCQKKQDGCYHCTWKYEKFDSTICDITDPDQWEKDHTPVGNPKDYIVCK